MDPILSAPAFSSLEKRCLTAFSAEPDGLALAIPATVTVPVPPLAAEELALWALPDIQAASYQIALTNLDYSGDQGILQAEITHFSGHAAVGARSKIEVTGDPLPSCCSQVPTPPSCCCTTFHVEVTAGDVLTGEHRRRRQGAAALASGVLDPASLGRGGGLRAARGQGALAAGRPAELGG